MWKARNKMCIAQEPVCVYQLVREARCLAATINLSSHHDHTNLPRWVTWHPTREVGAILNIDGSCSDDRGRAGFGGLVRTEDRAWRIGFYGFLGSTEVLRAELVAIHQGLTIAWSLGAKQLIAFSDSATAVKLVTEGVQPLHRFAAIVCSIRDLLRRPRTTRLIHTLRESNYAADALAKRGAKQDEPLCVLDSPPVEMRGVLLANAMRVQFVRGMT